MELKLRDVFDDGYSNMCEKIKNKEIGKYLVHAFCGVGKSRFIYNLGYKAKSHKYSLVLNVFPSLALINQYNDKYLSKQLHNKLTVCSDDGYTTDPDEIKKFIQKNGSKIICCTYQSLDMFIECLEDKKVDLVCFDEAHRTEGDQLKNIIYNENPFYKLGVFFTATPSNYMKKTLNRISYVPYALALEKGYLKKFELRVDIDNKKEKIDDTITTIYKSIARAILTTRNARVMTFHSFSNINDGKKSSVNQFTNEEKFKAAFEEVCESEFDNKNPFKNIIMKGITAKTKDRNKILDNFNETKDDSVYVLCSCRTIGEGIDTKYANMCVFVDPKQSYKDIIQNIGRIVRKTSEDDKIATVLIPTLIDFSSYCDAETKEEKDTILRENINSNLDYNCILQIVSALKQDNEEYFDMCLSSSKKKYDKISYRKEQLNKICQIKVHVNKELKVLWKIDDADKIIEDSIVSGVIDCVVDHTWEDKLQEVKDYIDEHGNLPPRSSKNTEIRFLGEWIHTQKQNYKNKTHIMSNPEIRDQWEEFITSEKYRDKLMSNEEKWQYNLQQVKDYIDEHGNLPLRSGETKEIRFLGVWINTQKYNYKNKTKIMSNSDIRDQWEEFITSDKYKKYFISNEEIWEDTFQEVKDYIDQHGKLPPQGSKNKEIRSLGKWISHQKENYKNKTHIMSNPEIRDQWEEFTTSDNYKKYFMSNEEKWQKNLQKVKDYIDKHGNLPPESGKNKTPLGDWIHHQKQNYKNKTHIMSNPEILDQWEEFITSTKYSKNFRSPEEKWQNNLQQVKKYIDEHGNLPSQYGEAKFLGRWICHQKKNYKIKRNIMSNPEIRVQWEEFITSDKYKKYFMSPEEKWQKNLQQVKKYIKQHEKLPPQGGENKTPLGIWIYQQKQNFKKEDYRKKYPERCKQFKQGICRHKWTCVNEDDIYHYKKCENCGRRSKKNRLSSERGYHESNPEKKDEINKWLSQQSYNQGIAIVLDAINLKTSNHLLEANKFTQEEIIIPEYDTDTYEQNSKDKKLGKCLRNNDFLSELKKIEPEKLSLIYADFTGSYDKFVKPLLEYLNEVKNKLQKALLLGITWSDNGAGTKNDRSEIFMDLVEKTMNLGFERKKERPSESGYGHGGNMNVQFFVKIDKQ